MSLDHNAYSYEDAISELDARGYLDNNHWLKIQNSTYIRTVPDESPAVVEVRHHETTMVWLYSDGVARVHNGNYYSESSRRRINAAISSLGAKIVVRQKQWVVIPVERDEDDMNPQYSKRYVHNINIGPDTTNRSH